MNTASSRPSRRYPKPVVLPDKLELLDGPTSGVISLPRHLDWSGHAEYDLDRPGRIIDLYRAVLNEAAKPADLYAYLDAQLLKRLWTYMWLPPIVRNAWEQRFPELAQISRIAAA